MPFAIDRSKVYEPSPSPNRPALTRSHKNIMEHNRKGSSKERQNMINDFDQKKPQVPKELDKQWSAIPGICVKLFDRYNEKRSPIRHVIMGLSFTGNNPLSTGGQIQPSF